MKLLSTLLSVAGATIISTLIYICLINNNVFEFLQREGITRIDYTFANVMTYIGEGFILLLVLSVIVPIILGIVGLGIFLTVVVVIHLIEKYEDKKRGVK